VGAEIGLTAMEHGKHLVMMNVEADVTIGAYLAREAKRLGVVYTLGAGDEPSSTMELVNFVTGLGYPIVAAGKGKNNPLNIDATPDAYMDEAKRRNMNPRMLVEFVDGSKTMVEMAAIANATGLVPDCPGMHGPAATLDQLEKVLCPKADGGVLSKKGVVDYSIGKGVAPGVFVIAEMAHPRVRERMHDLKLGPGPYYTFYRPYHLTSLEVPLSCARAVLYHTADMVPLDVPSAEVCAVAKRDLSPGERLDAIGEYTYRAWIMTVADAVRDRAVPCGLLENGKATKPIRKGELLTYHNCAVDGSARIVALRQRQDDMLKGSMT
jgi:predicted homoserine dehydrogenase-like protein